MHPMSTSLTLLVQKYTLFANASTAGLPPVRTLFYEFPDEPELFTVDRQWLQACRKRYPRDSSADSRSYDVDGNNGRNLADR
jgi:hypothetical protein